MPTEANRRSSEGMPSDAVRKVSHEAWELRHFGCKTHSAPAARTNVSRLHVSQVAVNLYVAKHRCETH
ncbi:hypothetical protein NCCP2145_10910 [Pseudarthrobacter sp. NCCP-2145]|nr:hypothetical protein NCCP2145_10910 [Pseudarthrobacter sp. NCCP-2145]